MYFVHPLADLCKESLQTVVRSGRWKQSTPRELDRVHSRQDEMMIKDSDIEGIVSCILAVDPYRIVLFGSHAVGSEDSESDVDLLVVLDSEEIAQTYDERMRRRLLVRSSIREINMRVPVDLLVYTRAEYELLKSHGAALLKEVESLGKTLYEKAR